jgi:hypothetical protein
VVLLAILFATRKSGHSSSAAGPSTTAATSTSSTSTSTSSTSTSTTSTSTTSTSTTTSTTEPSVETLPAGSNRAPTADEQQAITAAAEADHPGYDISLIRIADSDATWAAVKMDPQSGNGEGPLDEIRHQQGGVWGSVSYGTAQVDCSSSVPINVEEDFADVLGACPAASSGQGD